MEFVQKSIKLHNRKHQKIIKGINNNQEKIVKKIIKKSTKIDEKHLQTIILPLQRLQEDQNISKRPRGDHFTEFWGSPGTPLGSQKSLKSQKNGVRKLMKNQKDSKEPPKADLHRSGVARSSKMRSKRPTIGLRRLFFSYIRFHHEISCFFDVF